MRTSQKSNDHANDPDHAFNRALRYLTLRARSKKEIENYLLKKGFEAQVIAQAIERLEGLKFLNDEAYGESFMRSRQIYKGKSRYFVSYELKQKGLDQEIIDKVIGSSQEDIQTAREFIERKKRIYGSLGKKEFQEKMIRLLSSRGFSFETIKKALLEE